MNQDHTTLYGTNGFHLEYAGGRIALARDKTPAPERAVVTPERASQIALMRRAGEAIAAALKAVKEAVEAGERSTLGIDSLAERILAEHGCSPSFKGYQPPFATEPYAYATCISVGAEVVHGMPSTDKVLKDGDIITVDLGANFEGWHADSATTFGVGTLSSAANNLIVVTKNALKEGVKKAREGNTIGDIGCAVYGYAVKNGLRPAHGLTGHFIGNKVHLEPSIPNVPPHPLAKDVKLVAGMTFCIEPMLVTGSGEVDVQADGWTICTKDGSLSAHFEHTVEVTAGGQPARILTRLAE